MVERPLLRSPSLSGQILDILIERISGGMYPPHSQLPPENNLAVEFGVSRATIRSAIDILASRGLVMRRQGIGTFVTPLVRIRNPLNQFIALPELIASCGLTPGFRQVSASLSEAGPSLARSLQVEPDSQVLFVRKVFTADGSPAVYVVNHFPAWVYAGRFSAQEIVQPGITEPIFDFLEQRCGQQVARYIASLRAERMHDCQMQDLGFPYDPGAAVLVIDEIGYNAEGRPVHHSVEHHPNNWMTFELIRSRGPLSGL